MSEPVKQEHHWTYYVSLIVQLIAIFVIATYTVKMCNQNNIREQKMHKIQP